MKLDDYGAKGIVFSQFVNFLDVNNNILHIFHDLSFFKYLI